MIPIRLARLLAPAVVLAATAATELPARAREISLRPDPAAPSTQELTGRARSYYAYCLSQQAMLVRDYQAARIHLEDAVEADPSSAELQMELARVYLSLRRADDAMERAREATRLEPGNPEPRRLLVDLYRLQMSRSSEPSASLLEEAVKAHEDLLELDPDDGDARLSLARLHYAAGRHARAAEVLEPYVKAHPEETDAAFLRARALTRSGREEEALEILEAAVKAQPGLAELRAALAEAREAAGDMAGAQELLQGLVDEFPDRPEYRFALARIQELRGRHAEAAAQARHLVEIFREAEPGTRDEADLRAAMIFLVEATANSGELDRALQMNLAAERRFPGDPRFNLKRAEILYMQRNDAAADSILTDLATRPSSSVPRSRLSMVLLRVGAREERAGDHDRAEWLLRRAIRYDPGNHAALNYLGYMLADGNRELEEALELIRRAVKLDGSNGAYLDSLGWALFRLGRLEEAERQLLHAAETIPTEAVVHDHLGDVYWAQGRQGEAVSAWEEAIRLGIEDIPAVEAKIQEAAPGTSPR